MQCLTIVETKQRSLRLIVFILFLFLDYYFFSDYCREIIDYFVYLTKYCEIMPWTQKIVCMKTFYDIKTFKIQKDVQSQHIFKQKSDFQVDQEL